MTCIVGIIQNGVWIGCDSSASDGWEIRQSKLQKVFQVGEFLIGYTSSFRMGQILQYKLQIPPQTVEDDLEYLATTFIDHVKDVLTENDFAKNENGEVTGGTFLVGYRGNLYEIFDDFQVNQYEDGFTAIGSGSTYALGSLYSSAGDPEIRLKLALQSAAHFSTTVCEPFYLTKLTESI